MPHNFAAKSHKQHAKHFENDLIDAERIKITKSWFTKNTADYLIHKRAYEFLDCFSDKTCSWLAIGDERWGLDSICIKRKGEFKVLLADIYQAFQEKPKRLAHIPQSSTENAEQLAFLENSFDYVFCFEPNGDFPALAQAQFTVNIILKNFDKDCLLYISGNRWGKAPEQQQTPAFETSGNYVCTLSKYEAYKIAYDINLPQLAFSGLNDHYAPGVEFEPTDDNKSALFKDVVERVYSKDESCRKGNVPHYLLMMSFLKESLSDDEAYNFPGHGWKIVNLQRNPYL